MNCAREGCGDDIALHGRRGHGVCRARSWTAMGRVEAERIVIEERAKGTDEGVIAVVLRTLQALPGMYGYCGCKRYLKGRRKPAPGPTTHGCSTRGAACEPCASDEAARAEAPGRMREGG